MRNSSSGGIQDHFGDCSSIPGQGIPLSASHKRDGAGRHGLTVSIDHLPPSYQKPPGEPSAERKTYPYWQQEYGNKVIEGMRMEKEK